MLEFAKTITVDMLEADPYPIYKRMRREAPVCWVDAVNLWFVTRWDDVDYVAKHPELFTAEVATSPVDKTFGKPTVITSDGPVHKELRQGIDPKYRPRKVDSYIKDLVYPIAMEYLERFRFRGQVELMSEYFEPISTLSLARSLGLYDVDMSTLRRWFYGLAQGATNFENDLQKQAIADATSQEISDYITPVFARLELEPDHSALSHMLHDGMPEGQTRSREFLLPSIKVTLLGGMQEPGHGAGSILLGLLTHPEQMQAILGNMENLLAKAVDEGLRWVAPIGTQTRQTTQDVELGGVTIPKGQAVAALVSSACRDESRFTNPDAFNIYRDEGPHAAFGFGMHFCSGHWFARQQVSIALQILLENLPTMKLIPEQMPVMRGWEFRAPSHLHVRF
jgi:cytochrome P450